MNYGASSHISPAAEIQQRPVSAAQQGLDDSTNRLHSIIGELEQRLQPLLGPSKPQSVGDSPVPPTSTVSARIRLSSEVVNGAANRIEEILSRLEV